MKVHIRVELRVAHLAGLKEHDLVAKMDPKKGATLAVLKVCNWAA
jgi:flagellar motility protein MotE (MotC chaperone)